MKNKFYILSIDGGGLKGLIAIKILEIIEQLTGKKITDSFNLMAGTSTGGLITSAITVKDSTGKPGHDLAYVESMYLEAVQSLVKNGYGSGKETEKLDDLIRRTVKSERIADTYIPVFVPTYDMNSKKIVVFKTRSAILNEFKNVKLFDVCRATSAIPTIFPSYPVRYNRQDLNCVDAGWQIKNPAMAALAEFFKHKTYYGAASLKEQDVVLLSISTGNFSSEKKDWTTNIHDIVSSQTIATNYIRDQNLVIDLSKIKFMRIDLNFANQGYSFKTLMQIGDKIEALSKDEEFRNEIQGLLKD